MDSHRRSRTTASPGVRVEVRSSRKQVLGPAHDERGQAMVEFALAIPVVLTLLLAVVVFGVAFNNDLQLTFATSNATQQLSILRGQTTDPCKDTSKVLFAAAPTLNQSKIKFTIVLNGTTVAGPNAATPTCSGSQTNLVQSANAQVTATYP